MENLQIPEQTKALTRDVIKKALVDKSYKERLIKNPLDAFREINPNFNTGTDARELVVIDQMDHNKIYINVSLLSFGLYGGELDDVELSEEELEMVAGGLSCLTISCNQAMR